MNIDKKYARKQFGQNFIQDENILKKIVSIIDLEGKDILEIGPGKAALTKYLIEKAKTLTVFEIDLNLIEYLKELYKAKPNFKLVEGDFLKANLSSFTNHIIVANIPYNITTDIVFKIFENYQCFDQVILMVQKEFAQRMSAKIKNPNYGKLSITTQLFYDASCVFDVPPSAFFPQPKVTSTIIHLKRRQNNLTNKKEFMNFVKKCFAMKRKTLINNLKAMNYDVKIFEQYCNDKNLSLASRPENLELVNYLELFEKYSV